MIFSSLEFLCVFLPLVFLLHCLIPDLLVRNGLLIAASLIFYAYGEPRYVILMVVSALLNYLAARMIDAFVHKKLVLALDVLLNLGLLVFFKYMSFLLDTFSQVSGMRFRAVEIALPVGISFFTFQALSYVIDVYRGKAKVQKSFCKVLLYISFFPQLIAGPIVKYREIDRFLSERRIEVGLAADGMRRFICGLGKKVLIANTMGQVADAVFAAEAFRINLPAAWIGAVSYMMQIYFDFSGYSDMAIGLGKMFGFQFEENFRYPYGACSVKEFWQRWHISLSTWFKEYVYIPLGGNRRGKVRTAVNKLIVFFSTGIWHGANWTFVLWGLYHGFFSVLEEHIPFRKRIPRPIGYLCTMLIVCIGFVLFRADTISQGLFVIGQMFTGSIKDPAGLSFVTQQLTPWFCVMLLAALALMAPVKPLVLRVQSICQQEGGGGACVRLLHLALDLGSIALLLWCMIRLSGNTYNPFIYFRF